MSSNHPSSIRPKWLTDPARDRKPPDIEKMSANRHLTELRKAVRLAADDLWLQRGGKDATYLMLRDAYAGNSVERESQ